MKIGIDKIIIPPYRNRRDGDDGALALLAASIRDVGLLHPPVVSPDYQLIAGGRRLAAIRRLGWTEVEVTVARNLTDALACLTAERDENECRLDLLPSEAVELGRRLEEMEREAAARRHAATTLVGPGQQKTPTSRHVVAEMDRTGKVDPAYRKVVWSSPAADRLCPHCHGSGRVKGDR